MHDSWLVVVYMEVHADPMRTPSDEEIYPMQTIADRRTQADLQSIICAWVRSTNVLTLKPERQPQQRRNKNNGMKWFLV